MWCEFILSNRNLVRTLYTVIQRWTTLVLHLSSTFPSVSLDQSKNGYRCHSCLFGKFWITLTNSMKAITLFDTHREIPCQLDYKPIMHRDGDETVELVSHEKTTLQKYNSCIPNLINPFLKSSSANLTKLNRHSPTTGHDQICCVLDIFCLFNVLRNDFTVRLQHPRYKIRCMC